MKISTKEFKSFSSIINRAKNKDSAVKSSIFIDPDEGVCSCIGENFNFRFQFEIMEENSEGLKPFRVDIERFLAVCNQFEELTIDENYIFHAGQDKFRIYVEADVTDSGFTFNYDDNDVKVSKISEDDLMGIQNALQFVGEVSVVNKNMDAIRIDRTQIISSNGSSIYQKDISNPIDFKIDMKDNIGVLMCDLYSKGFTELNIYLNEAENGISIRDKDKKFEVIAEPYSDVHLPDDVKFESLDEGILRVPDLEFVLNRVQLKNIIDFLGVFVSNSLNEPIVITCEEDNLFIQGKDTGDLSEAERYFGSDYIVSKPNEEGYQFSFSRKSVLPALSSIFTSENVIMKIGRNENDRDYFVRITSDDGSTNEIISAILLEI